MYAIVCCGGQQHKVSEGAVISVNLLPDAREEQTLDLDRVLLVADGDKIRVGAPYLDGVKVTAEVVGTRAGEKLKIVKFRRRKHYQKVTGHRQRYTELKITGIVG